MATTHTLIEAKTLASETSAVEFLSIPNTYTDLKVIISGKNSTSSAHGGSMIFNTDSAAVTSKYVFGDGASPATGDLSYMYNGSVFGTNSTTDVFNISEIYIPNYTGPHAKCYVALNGHPNQATTGYNNVITGRSVNTTSAINKVTLYPGSGNWIVKSTFYLYGIKNS
jgi:hypothetical protein